MKDTKLVSNMGMCGLGRDEEEDDTHVKDLQTEPLHNIPPLQFWDSIRYVSKRSL